MKNILRGLLVFIIYSMAVQTASASLAHTSVRASAMGEAVLANQGEAASVFCHPAGLTELSAPSISSFYRKPYAGLPGISLWAGDLAVAVPFEFGVLAAGYSVFQTDALLREQVAALEYGRRILPGMDLGATVKFLSHDYLIGSDPLAAADPVFQNGTAKSAVGVDVGLGLDLDPLFGVAGERQWRFGAAARNLNQPDWGLASTDRIMLELQTGLAWHSQVLGLTVMGDLLWVNTESGQMSEPLLPAVGLEQTLGGDSFALRLGANPLEATGGFGLKWGGWSLDYALNFKFNLLADNFGSHQIGLTYGFGAPAVKAALARPAPARTQAMPRPQAAARPAVQPAPAAPAEYEEASAPAAAASVKPKKVAVKVAGKKSASAKKKAKKSKKSKGSKQK